MAKNTMHGQNIHAYDMCSVGALDILRGLGFAFSFLRPKGDVADMVVQTSSPAAIGGQIRSCDWHHWSENAAGEKYRSSWLLLG